MHWPFSHLEEDGWKPSRHDMSLSVSALGTPWSPSQGRPCFVLVSLSPSLSCELLVGGPHFRLKLSLLGFTCPCWSLDASRSVQMPSPVASSQPHLPLHLGDLSSSIHTPVSLVESRCPDRVQGSLRFVPRGWHPRSSLCCALLRSAEDKPSASGDRGQVRDRDHPQATAQGMRHGAVCLSNTEFSFYFNPSFHQDAET